MAKPKKIAYWFFATRPKTLSLAISPVSAGIALAFFTTGIFIPWIALDTLLTAISIQIGTNLYNDVRDFERGTDTQARIGPARATAQGWFSAHEVKLAAHFAFGCAVVGGFFLVLHGGWQILLVGLAALSAGYAYTSGKFPIAYGPWGEIYVLTFFGIAAVEGSYFLQTLAFAWPPLGVGIALGLPAAAVLLINNYRDLDTDLASGRRTLCSFLGRTRARFFYTTCLLIPLGIPWLLDLPGVAWPSLLILPFAVILIKQIQIIEGIALNQQLAATALFQVVFTVLLILGWSLPK